MAKQVKLDDSTRSKIISMSESGKTPAEIFEHFKGTDRRITRPRIGYVIAYHNRTRKDAPGTPTPALPPAPPSIEVMAADMTLKMLRTIAFMEGLAPEQHVKMIREILKS